MHLDNMKETVKKSTKENRTRKTIEESIQRFTYSLKGRKITILLLEKNSEK